MTPRTCNYCKRPPVVLLRWMERYVSRGHRRVMTITAAACTEHENCVNFIDCRKRHPEAREERRAAT